MRCVCATLSVPPIFQASAEAGCPFRVFFGRAERQTRSPEEDPERTPDRPRLSKFSADRKFARRSGVEAVLRIERDVPMARTVYPSFDVRDRAVLRRFRIAEPTQRSQTLDLVRAANLGLSRWMPRVSMGVRRPRSGAPSLLRESTCAVRVVRSAERLAQARRVERLIRLIVRIACLPFRDSDNQPNRTPVTSQPSVP